MLTASLTVPSVRHLLRFHTLPLTTNSFLPSPALLCFLSLPQMPVSQPMVRPSHINMHKTHYLHAIHIHLTYLFILYIYCPHLVMCNFVKVWLIFWASPFTFRISEFEYHFYFILLLTLTIIPTYSAARRSGILPPIRQQ